MSDNEDELSFSELRKKRSTRRLPARPTFEPALATYEFPPASTPRASQTDAVQEQRRAIKKCWLPFDPMRVVTALKSNRGWLLWSAAGCALLGLVAGWLFSQGKISVTLVLRDVSTTFSAGDGEKYRPTPLAMQTLVELMTSQELARRVAAQVRPAISETALKDSVHARLSDEKDMVTLTVTGKSRSGLVALAGLYAGEAVRLGRELQLAEVSRMHQFYKDRIAAAEHEMARINDELVLFQRESGTIDPEAEAQTYSRRLSDLLTRADSSRIELEMLDMQIVALRGELGNQNPMAQKIESAKNRLMDLLGRYTEMHPTVVAQREQIAALEKQLADGISGTISATSFGEGSVGGALYMRLVELQARKATIERELGSLDSLKQSLQDKVTGVSRQSLRYAVIRAKLDSQKNSLTLLAGRQREAQLYEANAAGYFRLFANPTAGDVSMAGRWVNSAWLGLVGLLVGVLLAGLAVGVKEISDGRVKTSADVERVTRLPVLASAGDLNAMTAVQREQWAFRTWTALSGHLSATPNRGLVCGIVSSSEGEGRSTWIKALAGAAAQRGLRVMTVAAEASASGSATGGDSQPDSQSGAGAQNTRLPQLLKSPMAMVEQLGTPNAPAMAQIALSGWVWNLDCRRQWQEAMQQCQEMENSVLLVELPPASNPESVLLAENLPQVIWLADSGRARARETRQQLETLRHAKCRLAGAVLNHEPEPAFTI